MCMTTYSMCMTRFTRFDVIVVDHRTKDIITDIATARLVMRRFCVSGCNGSSIGYLVRVVRIGVRRECSL